MRNRTILATRTAINGHLKLARLLQMPEKDFEAKIRELEDQELFQRFVALGVVSVRPYENARISARRFAGWELRSQGGDGLGDLLDGKGELAALISRIGQDRFQECFLSGEGLSHEERACACEISAAEARQLGDLVNRLYIQETFNQRAEGSSAPLETFSVIAGIEIDHGIPVLGFFNREIWKGFYRIDESKRDQLLASLGQKEASRAQHLLSELDFAERRKSTLHRVLEFLLANQSEYLVSGDPERRCPLTQRAVASSLNIIPSVLNRLISNKSVQLPWSTQAPMKALMPSRKSLARDRVYDLAVALPDASDERLSDELRRLHGFQLSRRSIAQYRSELGLGDYLTRNGGFRS